MKTLLISACLLGARCRYDGGSKPQPGVEALAEQYRLIPVCPEQLGGLPTPRSPSERQGDRVVSRQGRDVTAEYRRGAEEALRLLDFFHAEGAVLKERHLKSQQPQLRLRHDLRRQLFRRFDGGRRRVRPAASGARRSRVRGIRHPRPAGKSMNFTIPIPF